MTSLTRRGWLGAGALLGALPCACLAKSSQDCCVVPEAPADAVRIEPERITIDLDRTPVLRHTGSAIKVIDASRKLQVMIAHTNQGQFVALDQKCTHGGGALTYVHKHKHLYCTCWGHAKFALDGSVLRWPNKQVPRPLRAYEIRRVGNVLEIRL